MPADTNRPDAHAPEHYEIAPTGCWRCKDCRRQGRSKGDPVIHARNCDVAPGKSAGPRSAEETAALEALPTDGEVILGGDTFPHKAAIKAAGGKWSPATKTWTVPAAAARDLLRLAGLRVVSAGAALCAEVDRQVRAVKAGEAAVRGVDDEDVYLLQRAGLVSMSDAMNQDF